MNRLYVETDGDRYPRDVYIVESQGAGRFLTMHGDNENTMRHYAQRICDMLNDPNKTEAQAT
mgnify:CR=1 FL=1